MFLRRYQKLVSQFAIAVVLFASLAPTISHALALHNNDATFTQSLCTSSGNVLVIQVATTKGQQLSTELPTQAAADQSPADGAPKGTVMHLAHCPFCNAGGVNAHVAPPSEIWLFTLPELIKFSFVDDAIAFVPTYFKSAHRSRAPPVTL